jgi:diguanylate cyclase
LRRAAIARPVPRLGWIAMAAVMSGAGVWATHFIAMLAFDPGLPISFDVWLTILSALVGIALSALAYTAGFALPSRTAAGAVAGLTAGLGFSALHFTGMLGLRIPGDLHWDEGLVGLSIGLASTFMAAALAVGLRRDDRGAHLLATGLFSFGVIGLHITGMSAVTIFADPLMPAPMLAMPKSWLALAVGIAAALLLALALGATLADRYLQLLELANDTRLREVANASSEGIAIHDGEHLLAGNRSLAELTGRAPAELVGLPVGKLFKADVASRLDCLLRERDGQGVEVELARIDGGTVPVEFTSRSLDGGHDGKQVLVCRDLRERREAAARMRRLALHDPLTALPNRRFFAERLAKAVEEAQRAGELLAVLCLDLDRFKSVNDLLGHEAGDELLRQVGMRLLDSVRNSDTVARLGGDEFAIIRPRLRSADGAARLAAQLVKALGRAYDLDGHEMVIGASIGIALCPTDGTSPDMLLRNADLALYRAKADGRGTFRAFQPEMDMLVKKRRALERDLRLALSERQFVLHYQPMVDCRTGVIAGYEALARWRHPVHGLVPPAEFIGLAEESGLILPLGEIILRAACREAAGWKDDLYVSVNLSPAQFGHGDLTSMVRGVLEETGLAPHRLKLEVTESVLIDDTDRGLAILRSLHALGVRIALDDFGTGYSSLSYLHRFAFDEVKIDRSFVQDIETSADARAIVRTIINLGRSLRIMVTAEGVETSHQFELLQAESCDQVQGYLFGAPAPTLIGGPPGGIFAIEEHGPPAQSPRSRRAATGSGSGGAAA